MLTDDLPWPELGNVSRGATRGNQGQKGVLSPPNLDGRSLIQLRVQPGVLTVLLNRQATDWYRVLDAEVNHALKLTKTYWRKARRRQDYDPVADQDHMELHEWLQQLKDKVMSHLELLMQRGDIKGPPYVMPDNVELTFLRKFIERQAARVPHNPRLRKAFLDGNGNRSAGTTITTNGTTNGTTTTTNGTSAVVNDQPARLRVLPPPSESPEPSDESVLDGATSSDEAWDTDRRHLSRDRSVPRYSGPLSAVSYTAPIKSSPRLGTIRSLEEDAESSNLHLQSARSALRRAQKATQETFSAYTASLDAERRLSHEVAVLEDRRDHLLSLILRQNQNPRPQGAPCPFPGCACIDGGGPDGGGGVMPMTTMTTTYSRKALTYDSDNTTTATTGPPSATMTRYTPYGSQRQPSSQPLPPPSSAGPMPPMRSAYAWDDRERDDVGSPHTSSASVSVGGSPARKHARSWDLEDPPIRKRLAGSASGSPPMHTS